MKHVPRRSAVAAVVGAEDTAEDGAVVVAGVAATEAVAGAAEIAATVVIAGKKARQV
jgi:hypothetical protein